MEGPCPELDITAPYFGVFHCPAYEGRLVGGRALFTALPGEMFPFLFCLFQFITEPPEVPLKTLKTNTIGPVLMVTGGICLVVEF